jgi:N-acyl amino acid synthase of PEP-CTERM/exosortase system
MVFLTAGGTTTAGGILLRDAVSLSVGKAFQDRHDLRDRGRDSLLDRFNAAFQTICVSSRPLLEIALNLRYQVYCLENGFEDPEEHGGQMETDQYDAHSVHSLLIYRPAGCAVGTVRLVLPSDGTAGRSLALQRVSSSHPALRGGRPFCLEAAAEVSRFGISKQARSFAAARQQNRKNTADFECLNGPLMRLGLIQGLVRMSTQNKVRFWCAVVEPKMLRMLGAMGIYFHPIGPLVQHKGLRQPCYCDVAEMLRDVRRERPSFWSILTDGGKLAIA